jgi:hypothetical protein
MENTRENKLRFFAQYWGQDVYYQIDQRQLKPINVNPFTLMEPDNILLLKPISLLTDEDATSLRYTDQYIEMLKGNRVHGIDSVVADKLRSKGYAMPYMGISVDELIEYKWIELTTI